MSKLGISIYPEHSTLEKDKAYIKLASSCGFESIFSCLLSVEDNRLEETKAELKELCAYAKEHGMEVTLDVAPHIFHKLGISYEDLSFFHEIGAKGIRLDEGFDCHKEAVMSYNPYGLNIVINASAGTKYLDHILSYQANRNGLVACHNFYPQAYTGLSMSHFIFCNESLKKLQMPIGAFVSSQAENTFGPWPVYEGLCTLEEHRNLPLDVQVRHLQAMGTIDEILIGNAYATQEELESIAKIDSRILTFKLELEEGLSALEQTIIFDHPHFVRGDMSAYMARSTMPRITYAKESVPVGNTRDLKRGDVVVINDRYGRYKGELHIVLENMPNKGDKNVVGTIPANEMMLMEYLVPWRPFTFMK